MDEDNQARLKAAAAMPPPVFAVLNEDGCIDAAIGDTSQTHQFSAFVSLAQLVERKEHHVIITPCTSGAGTGRGIMFNRMGKG